MPKGDRKILKADLEDGFAQIANLLLEAVAIATLGGREKGAILALWRKTYGWVGDDRRRCTEVVLSQRDWAWLLNTHQVYAARVVNSLVDKNIFKRVDLGKGKGYQYSMNTRVYEWDGGKLISLDITNRFSTPPTKRFRDPSTKQFTPLDTNLRMVNKRKTNLKQKKYKEGEGSYGKVRKNDPDKYIKGKYGHIVQR